MNTVSKIIQKMEDQEGRIVGYFLDSNVAFESLKISYSGYEALAIEQDIISITVHFDGRSIRYVLSPIEVILHQTHL